MELPTISPALIENDYHYQLAPLYSQELLRIFPAPVHL